MVVVSWEERINPMQRDARAPRHRCMSVSALHCHKPLAAGLGQTGDDVCEAADFGEGRQLGSDVNNVHGVGVLIHGLRGCGCKEEGKTSVSHSS